jgi:ABC-type branched-subunit amino acid transport system ATPase component
VPNSEVVPVLGSNGAGRITPLRTVSSVLPLHRGTVDSGSMTSDGKSLLRKDPSQGVDLEPGRLADGSGGCRGRFHLGVVVAEEG